MRIVAALAVSTFFCNLYATIKIDNSTIVAFDKYVSEVEAKAGERALPTLAQPLRERVAKGEIIAVPFTHRTSPGEASLKLANGLVSHWLGVMFLPGVSVAQVRAILESYDSYSRIYAPDVAISRQLSHHDSVYEVFLRLSRTVKVKALMGYTFPVEFNANYRVQYLESPNLLQVHSVATRIAEVKDPKGTHTLEYPVGDDEGYLWRLNSYWRIYPDSGGVMVECEAVSLSRSVPGFVEKMVTYFTTNFPEESMRSTLKSTRDALKSRP